MKILRITGFSFFFVSIFSTRKYNFLKKVDMPFLGQRGGDLLMFVFIWFLLLKLCVKEAP